MPNHPPPQPLKIKPPHKVNAPSAIPQASQTGLNIQESPAIEVHFEPQEEELISSLLNRLGACREDEAPQEAATRLASMALMLANIASGHLRIKADGIVCDPGVDFIIEGSMASAEFVESVIGPVSWVQDRLERNLLYDVVAETPRPKRESHIAELRRLENMEDCIALPVPSMRKKMTINRITHREALQKLDEQERLDANIMKERYEDAMSQNRIGAGKVLALSRQSTFLREVLEYPIFFTHTSSAAGFRHRPFRAHLGHQIVHAEIETAACIGKLRKQLAEWRKHESTWRSEGAPRVRSNLALCSARRVLDEAVAADPQRQGIPYRLLWLVESAPGCDLSDTAGRISENPAPDFTKACENMILKRIAFSETNVCELKELNGMLAKWRIFLRRQDQQHSGIAATVGNLPQALCYGFKALCHGKIEIKGDEVIAFARWLVVRMNNRIAVASAAGKNGKVERLASKVAEKLAANGPLKVRDLIRKCSRLTVEDCRAALDLLMERGMVSMQDGVWEMIGECTAPAPDVG